jgi:hypothetical protein
MTKLKYPFSVKVQDRNELDEIYRFMDTMGIQYDKKEAKNVFDRDNSYIFPSDKAIYLDARLIDGSLLHTRWGVEDNHYKSLDEFKTKVERQMKLEAIEEIIK